jgi:hypothetical protein
MQLLLGHQRLKATATEGWQELRKLFYRPRNYLRIGYRGDDL